MANPRSQNRKKIILLYPRIISKVKIQDGLTDDISSFRNARVQRLDVDTRLHLLM